MTLRHRHRLLLETLLGSPLVPYIGTGSKSMFRLELGAPCADALLLVCSGSLDRERRFACHIRTCDAEALLAHPGSALSCFWSGLAAPLVIPASVLAAPLGRLAPSGANQYPLKLRVQGDGLTLVPTETPVEQFVGGTYLRALRDSVAREPVVPRLTHFEWQTFVAAVEHRQGCEVAVPANDRTRLDAPLLRAAGLARVDALPALLRGSRAEAVDVVATPRGSAVPVRLIEVEHRNDIRAALHRCAQVLAHLEPAVGAARLPRVVIVADAARRAAFERYVAEPPLPATGLTARAEFRSYAQVYGDALRLLPGIPAHLRAA
jgi:hypothetical protein